MKKVLVCGSGGFIGGHLVKKLKREGCWVRGVDLKMNEFSSSPADEFIIGDLTDTELVREVLNMPFDEVYQLAADMGGAGYIFTGENDANLMHNSSMINLNVINQANKAGVKKIFYSSSACIYPSYNQQIPIIQNVQKIPPIRHSLIVIMAGKNFLANAFILLIAGNYNMNVKIARFHNIFGPEGTWSGGREKAPAALCRKVAEAPDGGSIEIWGDGKQTRSFLYIDECLEAVHRLMESDFNGPVNIGSEEMVSVNQLAELVMKIANKPLSIKNVNVSHIGVRGRNSDNKLIKEKLGWAPGKRLSEGLEKTYQWVSEQVLAEVPVV
jgi:GDP-D-mannose 3',5'-epimerase